MLLRESAEGHLSQHHSNDRFRQCRTTDAGFDLAFWKSMGALGWTGVMLPENVGGSQIGLDAALALADVFGQRLVPEPFVASAVMAGTLLSRSTAPRAADAATRLAEGASVVLLADQEVAGDVSPDFPRTSLNRLDDGFLLSGQKVFVPHWCTDAYLLVTAALDGQHCVVLLEPGQAGIDARTTRMGDGTQSADIVFDNIALPADAVVLDGASAAQATKLAVANGTIAMSAQLEGLSRRLHQMTCEYLVQRVQFGRPLADFQALRHDLADLAVEIDLAGSAWRYAAKSMTDVLSDQALIRISAAKARCSDCALAIARTSIQFHGAFGYTEEADVGLYVNSALRWSSWLGNGQFHRGNALKLHRQVGHE